MKTIVVDDELFARKMLVEQLEELSVGGIYEFDDGETALEFVKKNHIECAFLDVQMPGVTGIDLARCLHEIDEEIKVVFITAHERYAYDAYQVNGISYLLKPYTKNDIEETVDKLYRIKPKTTEGKIRIKTFGGFEVYVEGERLSFSRSKSKELLALLVDKRGILLNNQQVAAYLWEDIPYDNNLKESLKKVNQALKASLKKAGIEDLLVDGYNKKGIDVTKIQCDYYDALEGKRGAFDAFQGDYLCCYSWAEMSNAYLIQKQEIERGRWHDYVPDNL